MLQIFRGSAPKCHVFFIKKPDFKIAPEELNICKKNSWTKISSRGASYYLKQY